MAGLIQKTLETLHLSSPEKGAPPQEPDTDQVKSLREKYKKENQEHVFAFYDELDTAGKASLFEQLCTFDPHRINILADKALHPPKESNETPSLEPLPASASASLLDANQEQKDGWYKAGLDHISKNKVAVVLMAGGQGTRLGSSDPKGCYDIGLPSRKSLFQVQAERIKKLQELAQAQSSPEAEPVIPWYVMTSGPTRKPTEKFFKEHEYFGLQRENVIIFEQGVLPCISNEGKILLESKSKVAVAPDGNGGIYQALLTSEARTDMRKRGIEHVQAYCVDNCLVKVADPVFIGFAASKDVDIATKVVRKRASNEPVGLIVQKNGKPDVVEYSEIDKETAEAKDSSDLLRFRAANIVNHYYSFRFFESIEDWAHMLPHHVARKKIPFMDPEKGETIKPEKPNGIKLEQFVFDVFPLIGLDKFACLEVERKEEFSPLKNARGTGEDDPDTSKKDILEQGSRWLHAAGAIVVSEEGETGVEVSPLISYGGEGLGYLHGREIRAPAVIEKSKGE
ncbi:UDP-N-acetylglucosamine pyrophosphorylase [Exophiala aquamarina CBS 119918]|uniref:UDP-N-acetylglucosamine diphosphorylase n=1 Tax=Exophiala aquamarina CBS 119918 TaxID=1182545 RepID=A0A072PBF3_9EURO|nr:UDP-N-acetylglucosamine pyrophosphorylase [Exophiala aquamarina CBS 119918]KEF57097.1 UDP-N-acetylglucosamine pyrophosphorylase [Exophiala aquamarina CBS 119918]